MYVHLYSSVLNAVFNANSLGKISGDERYDSLHLLSFRQALWHSVKHSTYNSASSCRVHKSQNAVSYQTPSSLTKSTKSFWKTPVKNMNVVHVQMNHRTVCCPLCSPVRSWLILFAYIHARYRRPARHAGLMENYTAGIYDAMSRVAYYSYVVIH